MCYKNQMDGNWLVWLIILKELCPKTQKLLSYNWLNNKRKMVAMGGLEPPTPAL